MTGEDSKHVSRSEFESHQKRVSADIENLVDAIREESKARARDTTDIRSDIKALSASAGRPQYQALGFAFGVFSFVIIALAGVYTWGETRIAAERSLRLDSMADTVDLIGRDLKIHAESEGHPGALNIQDAVEDLRRDVDRDRDVLAATLVELDDKLQKEIAAAKEHAASIGTNLDTKLQGEIEAADHESAGRHDVQAEKLRALERIVYGKGSDE